MYKILIIDDDVEERESVYSTLFSDPEGEFAYKLVINKEEDIMEEFNNSYFDLVLIDHNLDSDLTLPMVKKIISRFDTPIVLISDKRNFEENEYASLEYLDCIPLKPFFELIGKEQNVEAFPLLKQELFSRLKSHIIKYYGYSNRKKHRYTICHISDLHMSENDHETINNVGGNINNIFASHRSDLIPDIFVFSGDIAKQGKLADYSNVFFENIIKNLINIYPTSHFLFVPGNHDINYSYFMSDAIVSYEMKPPSVSAIEKWNDLLRDSDIENIFANKESLGLSPKDFETFTPSPIYKDNYKNFTYNITQDHQYLTSNNYVQKKSSRFFGFNLLGISNAETYRQASSAYKDNDETVNLYQYKPVNAPYFFNTSLPSICVGHASLDSLGYENVCGQNNKLEKCASPECNAKSNFCPKARHLVSFFENTKTFIYLHGHEHRNEIDITQNKRILRIGVGAIDGSNANSQTFNIIHVERTSSNVTCEIEPFNFINGKFDPIKSSVYSYNISTFEWKKD